MAADDPAEALGVNTHRRARRGRAAAPRRGASRRCMARGRRHRGPGDHARRPRRRGGGGRGDPAVHVPRRTHRRRARARPSALRAHRGHARSAPARRSSTTACCGSAWWGRARASAPSPTSAPTAHIGAKAQGRQLRRAQEDARSATAPRRRTSPTSATPTIGAGREHRRRHHHLQLRRREQAPAPRIEDGAFIGSEQPRWWRRSRSAKAPTSARAAPSPRTCPRAPSPSAARGRW